MPFVHRHFTTLSHQFTHTSCQLDDRLIWRIFLLILKICHKIPRSWKTCMVIYDSIVKHGVRLIDYTRIKSRNPKKDCKKARDGGAAAASITPGRAFQHHGRASQWHGVHRPFHTYGTGPSRHSFPLSTIKVYRTPNRVTFTRNGTVRGRNYETVELISFVSDMY